MRKAQSWIFDFIIGFLIFLGLLFLGFSLLKTIDKDSGFYDVSKESDRVSSIILSEGYPIDWNSSSVSVSGLLSGHRINSSKLNMFNSIDYDIIKALMNVRSDFVFYFKNSSGVMNVSNKCYNGFTDTACGTIIDVIDYDDLSRTDRIVVLDDEIVSLVVLSWN